jgi:hypothetical protein
MKSFLWFVCVCAMIGAGYWARNAYKQPLSLPTTRGVTQQQLQTAIDHSLIGDVLKDHVDAAGMVNYAAIKNEPGKLDRYIAHVSKVETDKLPREEKLALYINAYNAFTLKLITERYPLKSIMDIPEDQRWKAVRWNIGGTIYSLDQIENEVIRPTFKEPRIHFALVCAANSCPPLRNEMYTAAKLESQLVEQTKRCLSSADWVSVHAQANSVRLHKLLDWYAADFGDVLKYAATYNPSLAELLKTNAKPNVEYAEYDWALNVQSK